MKSKRLSFCFGPLYAGLLSIFSAPASAQGDDWLGDPYRGFSLSVAQGVFDEGSSNTSLSATVPLLWYSQLHAYYSQFNGDYKGQSQDSKQWSLALNSDPLATWSAGVSADAAGLETDVEHSDIQAFVQYSFYERWSLRLSVLKGEVDLNLSALPPAIEEQFARFGLLNRDRRGLGLSLQYDSIDWGLRLAASDYRYDDDEDIPASDAGSLLALIGDQSLSEAELWLRALYASIFERYLALGFDPGQARDFTNFIFQSREDEIRQSASEWVRLRSFQRSTEALVHYGSVYDQQSLLSERDISLDAYWARGDATWSFGLLHYTSYIEEDEHSQFYMGLDYRLGRHLSLGTLLNYASAGEVYAELSLGLDW